MEFLHPYDHAAAGIKSALDNCGLPLILFNAPPGHWQAGERCFAAVPGQDTRFRSDLETALAYTEILLPRHIHILAGNAGGPEAQDCFTETYVILPPAPQIRISRSSR